MRSLHGCPAPAKLNLFLHVTGRRADGYHLLQSAFQLIDYGDSLDFDLRDDERIVRTSTLAGVPAESDLVVRALRLLQAAYQQRHGHLPPGVDVAVTKRLPMGGGLGGGSSDAATALMALNHLWQAGFSTAQLMALGLPLGADIPFFLFGQNAFVEGVGEQMVALETPDCCYLVIAPGVEVPTASIFSASDLTRDAKPVKITDFSRHLKTEASLTGYGRNDLQAVATRLFPPVAEAVEWLGAYGDARMTGSGACVFCAFANEAEALAVLAKVPAVWRAFTASSLQRHPLLAQLQVGSEIE
ncbi:4-(cytidine 5'-diphospho)-2-C-methyl-D-erythritol kinase [Massilia sp. DWR3-1-1]|uniref:4-(cytidine 5'-diphospho)-2-C-methyl-D-erythritol kinase n=1 Tax=Massilia sp. DWR3-1-1 TaxID=2804559 RepID=UPI003CF65AAB